MTPSSMLIRERLVTAPPQAPAAGFPRRATPTPAASPAPVLHPALVRVCAACGVGYPPERFGHWVDSGRRRRICNTCIGRADAMLDAGHSCHRIAEATAIGYGVVVRRRDELGAPGRRHGRVKDPAKLVELFTDHHLRVGQIAQRLGVTERTVLRHLHAAGVLQPRTVRNPARDEAVVAFAKRLLDDGAPYAEVARSTGIDQKTLAGMFPGHDVISEVRSMYAAINARRDLRQLHEEIERLSPAA